MKHLVTIQVLVKTEDFPQATSCDAVSEHVTAMIMGDTDWPLLDTRITNIIEIK